MKKWLLCLMLLWLSIAQAQQSYDSMPARQSYLKGMEYCFGSYPTPKDEVKACILLKAAADSGNARAARQLGYQYEVGQGVPKRMDSCLYYYNSGGINGDGGAYQELSRMYKDDILVPQDYERSVKYCKKGIALGNTPCKNLLAYYYFKGLGVAQSYDSAFALYKQLEKFEYDINAKYFLGLCYRNGYGVKANETIAKQYLQKAAKYNDYQAKHELNAEATPENALITNPQIQQQVDVLKQYEVKFYSDSTNDISGNYTGYAIYYDCSGKFVHEIVPLNLSVKKESSSYAGVWTEADTLSAPIKVGFNGNAMVFDTSSQYSRCNYYSYRDIEKYQFRSAQLGIKYLNDSMYLSGNVRFYSLSRHEPGQPMYIVLVKAVGNTILPIHDMKLSLSPNPATNTVNATFTLDKTEKIKMQITDANGKITATKTEEILLPAGTYTYPVNVQQLSSGSYVLSIFAGNNAVQSKLFIKL
jgi:TPR repeat protein